MSTTPFLFTDKMLQPAFVGSEWVHQSTPGIPSQRFFVGGADNRLTSSLVWQQQKDTSVSKRQDLALSTLAIPKAQSTFLALQKFEGIVLQVQKETFVARLIDLTADNPHEEAEFSISEVSAEDRMLLKDGAIFYWNIGYQDSPSGNRTRVSNIRFRRIPRFSKKEMSTARKEAEEIGTRIGWK